ncbi:MAG: hypothetical protein F6K24_00240 [Okeania sp. SIO2D1]|nr:hypothetical protein [Okeania sp. SIO2D1]
MELYTPSQLRKYQCNLQKRIKTWGESSYPSEHEISGKYNEYYFQILILEYDDFDRISMKLVYGTKETLVNYYGIQRNCLPSTGAVVNPSFVSREGKNESLKILKSFIFRQ